MKITPLEIRQHTFEKAMRGYNKDEVHAFLLSISQEWEKINEENKDLKAKYTRSEQDVAKLREVESSLFKTLKTAEDTGSSMVEQAKKESELMLKESQMNSDAILNDARNQSKALIEEAEQKAKNVLIGMKDELNYLEAQYRTLKNDKENVLLELKNLSTLIMDKAAKFSKEEDRIDFKEYKEEASLEIAKIEETTYQAETPQQEEKEVVAFDDTIQEISESTEDTKGVIKPEDENDDQSFGFPQASSSVAAKTDVVDDTVNDIAAKTTPEKENELTFEIESKMDEVHAETKTTISSEVDQKPKVNDLSEKKENINDQFSSKVLLNRNDSFSSKGQISFFDTLED
ncbi:MAG: DivIVA domain-containing protein [Cyclobacteriaceae bacterium]